MFNEREITAFPSGLSTMTQNSDRHLLPLNRQRTVFATEVSLPNMPKQQNNVPVTTTFTTRTKGTEAKGQTLFIEHVADKYGRGLNPVWLPAILIEVGR